MAALGDAYVQYSNDLADDGYLDLLPAAGGELVIHNIYHEGAIEVYWYDGTNEVLIDEASTGGVMSWLSYHCTDSIRIRVKNVSGGTDDVGADGMYTHATS